jgi:hypothetical protein
MRTGLLSVALIGLVAVAPAMADIGAISLLLSSTDDNGANDNNTAVGIIQYKSAPAAIPVTVKFSATTKGATVTNYGVFGIFGTINGTALGDNSAKTMTLNTTFKKAMGVSVSSPAPGWNGPQGLGFDVLASGGTGGISNITGFGAAQASSASGADFGNLDAKFAGHPAGSHPTVAANSRTGVPSPLMAATEQFAGAVGPVTFATGSLVPAAMTQGITYQINVVGSGSLYSLVGTDWQTVAADSVTGSQLLISVVPEPSSLLLLSPMALLGLRRRRATA